MVFYQAFLYHFCIQLGRYKVYEGAQGYEVEG